MVQWNVLIRFNLIFRQNASLKNKYIALDNLEKKVIFILTQKQIKCDDITLNIANGLFFFFLPLLVCAFEVFFFISLGIEWQY